jgi:hypothetical protein
VIISSKEPGSPGEEETMKAIWDWIQGAWKWLENWTQFLDDASGKFSHKRLIALAFAVVAIRQLIIGDWFGAILAGAGSIALAIVSAITKT